MPELTPEERDLLPSTLERSEDKAQRTFVHTLESARESYGGDGESARRVAFAAVKHSYEKVGDHWEPKESKGPSDPQAELGGQAAREGRRETFGGVDVRGHSKKELLDRAKQLGVQGRSRMTKEQLAAEIDKANRRETARARRRDAAGGS